MASAILAGAVGCGGSASAPARASTPATSLATSPSITVDDLRQRLYRITDDSTQGRESGSRGAFVTTTYIAEEFKRLGLEPAGTNGSWFQVVPLYRVSVDPASRLSVGA